MARIRLILPGAIIGLAWAVPARRGGRPALIAIVMTRVISAALAVPASFLNAPVWVMIVEGLVIAGTMTALVLMHQQSRLA